MLAVIKLSQFFPSQRWCALFWWWVAWCHPPTHSACPCSFRDFFFSLACFLSVSGALKAHHAHLTKQTHASVSCKSALRALKQPKRLCHARRWRHHRAPPPQPALARVYRLIQLAEAFVSSPVSTWNAVFARARVCVLNVRWITFVVNVHLFQHGVRRC